MADETITPAAGVAGGAGVVDSRTQRVVHCTDDPAVSGIGTTLDTVVGDNTTPAASATAASGISLWKRIVNLLIAVLAKLPLVGTAGTASANVVTVQGIAGGTTLPVTEASAAAIAADTNELTAAPVEKTLTLLVKAVAAGPAPARFSLTSVLFRKMWLQAGRAAAVNTSLVYIGTAALVDTTAMEIALAPGDIFVVEMPPGTCGDLDQWWVDGATATDGVRGWYVPV